MARHVVVPGAQLTIDGVISSGTNDHDDPWSVVTKKPYSFALPISPRPVATQVVLVGHETEESLKEYSPSVPTTGASDQVAPSLVDTAAPSTPSPTATQNDPEHDTALACE